MRPISVLAGQAFRDRMWSAAGRPVLVAACVVSFACAAATPKNDDTFECVCKCDDACSDANVLWSVDPDLSAHATCFTVDSDYPNLSAANIPLVTRTCVIANAPATTQQAACNDRCNLTGHNATIKDFNLPQSAGQDAGERVPVVGAVGNPLLLTRSCQGVITIALESHKTCNVTPGLTFSQSALTASTGPSNTTVQATSQSTATAMLPNSDEGFDTVIIPPPTGTVQFSGGNCSGQQCPITIDSITLNVPAFVSQGNSIGPGVVVNTRPLVGFKDFIDRVSFTPNADDFFATATVNGVQNAGTLQSPPFIGGTYSPVSGAFELTGSFTDPNTNASLSIQLEGSATARPPIARANGNQTVACSASGRAAVSVTGAGSFEPDGNSMTFAWSEKGAVLSTNSVATLQLTSGTHNLILTATDSTGRSNQDTSVITVTDSVAPVFTSVPLTVAVETPGPVAIGQATATDGCGSAVTVTNNAPVSFPAGKTTVIWTATDASGNRATATQLVYVLPPTAASCPPGMHVILGTANNDVITGTSGADCIIGFGGQDHIDGGGGDDIIIGGDGDDVLIGGAGNDIIAGGSGQDNISGGDGDDILIGNDGDDTISGGNNNDTLIGGAGSDHLNGDAGNDLLIGNAGNDTLQGGAGTDRCISDPPPNQDVVMTCESS